MLRCPAFPGGGAVVIMTHDDDRWSENAAVAWVLSRDSNFAQACRRSEKKDLAETRFLVDAEASRWRQFGKPIMLFPTVEAARQRLFEKFEAIGPHVATGPLYSQSKVVNCFPPLDHDDRTHLLDSVWRGQCPNKQRWITLSNAGWWIASDHGKQLFSLDDRTIWAVTFSSLLQAVIDKKIKIDPPPPPDLPAAGFGLLNMHGEFAVEYPANASVTFAGSPYRGPSRRPFIACDLLNLAGDEYFANGKPLWSGLHVLSDDLVEQFSASAVDLGGTDASIGEAILDTRLGKIASAELPLLRSQTRRPKWDRLHADIKAKYSLSNADATAVVKVIWPGDGTPGRPPAQEKG
jgi:hypothetical protein